MNKNHYQKNAFSIIETAISLLIISVVIITLLIFHELNKNTDIKSFIIQISNLNSAVKSFYNKYGALPGDIESTVNFGLSEVNSDGNNNGLIEDRNGDIKSASGEIVNFWMHLSKSRFLDQNFDGERNDKAKIGSTFPLSKIGVNRGITVFGYEGLNYYQVGVESADFDKIIMSDNSLKAAEAFEIDMKIDDSMPKSGRIIAVSGSLVNGLNQNSKCVLNQEYNNKISTPSCQIRIEMENL